jgi:hypothetical protein
MVKRTANLRLGGKPRQIQDRRRKEFLFAEQLEVANVSKTIQDFSRELRNSLKLLRISSIAVDEHCRLAISPGFPGTGGATLGIANSSQHQTHAAL